MIRQLRVPERVVVVIDRSPSFACGYPSFEVRRMRRAPPALLGGCVMDGGRKWREPPVVREPDPSMALALARAYGVDVEFCAPVEG